MLFDNNIIGKYFLGQRGWQDAEVHDSRKMSTLILRYAREHHMGKYTLVVSNALGTAESNCDLIVRKKQFPPVFWQRLYNVSGEQDSVRYVGGVEVGGWPVPAVYWYRVMEDGSEEEVKTRSHTENWNGNHNKYVPSSQVEIRQIDQIRHCIIFNQVGEGYSGLYRVRAVNCLGEAECEAELTFEGEGGCGEDMYLPPLWRDKRRLTWRDEDMRKKPFVGFNEPELSPEEIEAMKKGSGLVPLSRITEYLASLPDYQPTNKFNNMERMPFKAGVDEHDYRPTRKGGSVRFPNKFQKGKITHHGYNSDVSGRILPKWHNKKDPRSRDSSDWRWRSVHPDLYIPALPERSRSPDPPPVWETKEDLVMLVKWLRSMGCKVMELKFDKSEMKNEKSQRNEKSQLATSKSNTTIEETTYSGVEKQTQQQKKSQVQKFSYTKDNKESAETNTKENKQKRLAFDIAHAAQEAIINHDQVATVKSTKNSPSIAKINTAAAKKEAAVVQEHSSNTSYEATSVYESHVTTSSSQTQHYKTEEVISGPIYTKQDNLSFPELEKIAQQQPPPALPPKTKIMHSPSR